MGTMLMISVEEQVKKKKITQTYRRDRSKAETTLIEIWCLKMSARFGHAVHQMRRKMM